MKVDNKLDILYKKVIIEHYQETFLKLDDNQKKIICQLKFSESSKKLVIGFSNGIDIDNLDDILKSKNELIARAISLLES